METHSPEAEDPDMVDLTVKEVASIERVTERTVWSWIHKRTIPIRRTPGGGIRIQYRRSAAAAVMVPSSTKAITGVYFVRCQAFVKIGCAADIKKRLNGLATGIPFNLELAAYIKTNDVGSALREEKQLHRRFKAFHHKGEWFRCDGDLADYIIGLTGGPQ